MILYKSKSYSVAAALAAADPERWSPKERTMLQRIADGDNPDFDECLKKNYIGAGIVVYSVDGLKFCFSAVDKGIQIGRFWG